MVLFRCCTFFQLLNAINIKLTLLPDVDADVVLNQSTDFSLLVEPLRQANIFKNIFFSSDTILENRAFRELPDEEKKKISKSPKKHHIFDLKLTKDYTDFYFAVEDEYCKLLYYYMVEQGMRLKNHLFDESKATYVIKVKNRFEIDGMAHEYWREKNFLQNLNEILLYEPDLYMADDLGCPVNRIPKIDYQDLNTVNLHRSIFGYNELPKEKYIFFEEALFSDLYPISDMDLLEQLASLVGKEKIVVKPHPRSRMDRAGLRGYKMFQNSKIPWEITAMLNDLSGKVLVAIASNAALSTKLVFDKPQTAIQLCNMLEVGKHAINNQYDNFDSKAIQLLNQEKMCYFKPDTYDHLVEVIKYINGGLLDDGFCRPASYHYSTSL